MAAILVDGFDVYNGSGANTGLQAKWAVAAGTVTMIAGRFGGQAARLAVGGSLGAVTRMTRSFTANASVSVGFAVQCSNLAVLSTTVLENAIMSLLSAATYMDGVYLTRNGEIGFFRCSGQNAGTSLGLSAAGVITTGGWHYIEVSTTISDTVGVAAIKVDGVSVLSLTNQDTRNGSPTTVDTVMFEGIVTSSGPTIAIDDLYIVDSVTPLGERRVETLYPTADTAQKQWTPLSGTDNYAMVDEAQCDGDTTYNQASVVGDTDRYTMGDLSSTPTTIDAVQISSFARKTDATSRSIANQIKSGATTSDGGNFALATTYSKNERLTTVDPNTSAAWTASAVNAIEVGPKVTV